MIYEMIEYADVHEFNFDARKRYDRMVEDRTVMSYDRPWMVDQVMVCDDGRVTVLWHRCEPARKKR